MCMKAEFCLDPSWQFLSPKQEQTCLLNEEILFKCNLWLLRHTHFSSPSIRIPALCHTTGSKTVLVQRGTERWQNPNLWEPLRLMPPDHNRIRLPSQPSCDSWQSSRKTEPFLLVSHCCNSPLPPLLSYSLWNILVCSSQAGSLGHPCMNRYTKSTTFSERQLSRFNKIVL